ncbi:MAG: hypothetical protein RL205_96 [Actinomycetota bacterium]
MSTDTPAASPVGPLLPILTTVGWILAAVILAVPTMFSPMLFDSGGSVWAVIVVFGLVSTLLLCGLSVVAGWIAWAASRESRGAGARVLRGMFYLLPLIGLAATAIGFGGIQFACAGNLNC